MERSTNRLIPGRARRDRALLTWRNSGPWAYSSPGPRSCGSPRRSPAPRNRRGESPGRYPDPGRPNGARLLRCGLGIYKAATWWERAAIGSAIFGFAPLIPYWVAAHAAVGAGNAARGVAIHAVGNAVVLILLLAPPLKRRVKGQVVGAKR
jgi:hypothetical protein